MEKAYIYISGILINISFKYVFLDDNSELPNF